MNETRGRTPPSPPPPRPRGPASVAARAAAAGVRDETTRPPGDARPEAREETRPDPAHDQPARDETVREATREEPAAAASRPAARASRSRPLSPIVPGSTVTGHALVAVVAIMTFLAALTVGTVSSVRTLASGWTSEISREVTIQIKPADGLDIDAALARATQVAKSTPGVAAARALANSETAKLLEPWLGAGVDVTNLPVPRLVVVTLASQAEPAAIQALKSSLAAQVPSASLDDHRQWSARLSSTARTVVAMGLGVLALVSAATILSVVFATRAAVAAGRPIVEVLHFVGARDSFIAAEFQHHFLTIGLKGGAIGGGAAMLLFFLLTGLPKWLGGGAGARVTDTLVGGMTLDLRGYGGIFGVAVLVALVTSATSRITVLRTLRSIN